MSSFFKITKHPITNNWEAAFWIDDYYGLHKYGVKFLDGSVFNPEETKLKTKKNKKAKIWPEYKLLFDPKPQRVKEKPRPIIYIEKFCDDLKAKLIAKFEKGAKEHGNEWRNVDITKEISQEIFDIINYHCMFLAKHNLK